MDTLDESADSAGIQDALPSRVGAFSCSSSTSNLCLRSSGFGVVPLLSMRSNLFAGNVPTGSW